MNDTYQTLLERLDRFIRKYYKNQIIRGLLLSLLLFSVATLLVLLLEYYGQFSVAVRTFLFYALLSLVAFVLLRFVLLPTLAYWRIGRTLSYEEAAGIISQHFADVEDSLLNTLELARSSSDTVSADLLVASINQRIAKLRPVPFRAAINFRANLKYAKYLAFVSLVFLLISFVAPRIFTDASVRIVNHNRHYEKPMPFHFVLLNDSLRVKRGSDFLLQLSIEGDYVPAAVSLSYAGNTFFMQRASVSKFTYEFKSLNNSLKFHFLAEDFQSTTYEISVLPQPVISGFTVSVKPPAYTGELPQTYSNLGDLTVFAGSRVSWSFQTQNVNFLQLSFTDSTTLSANRDSLSYALSRKIYENVAYRIAARNANFALDETIKYDIAVVPDLAPSIEVLSVVDSLNQMQLFFRGQIADDYGFQRLTFNYGTETKNSAKAVDYKQVKLPLSGRMAAQEFYYSFDFSAVSKLNTGDIVYYFEVWDNDGVRGSKSTRTQVFRFDVPSSEEISRMANEAQKNLEAKLTKGVQLAKQLREDIKNLQRKSINDEMTSWERNKMMQNIRKKQMSLEDLLENLRDENKQKNRVQNSFTKQQKDILEKEKQLEELMDKLLTDELKKLIEELNKLQEKFDQQKLNDLAEDLDMSYDDVSEQLERQMEMLKQFEVEQKISQTIDKLNDLANRQQKLSEQTKKASKKELADLQQKQEQQKSEFENLKKEYKDALKKNKELQEPMKLDDFKKPMDDVSKKMDNSSQQMQSGKKKQASGSQKDTSDKMKEMADEMQQMMDENTQQQAGENMEDLRQILDNLIRFSFDQEELMLRLKQTNTRDPQYTDLQRSQADIADNFQIVEDSLTGLARRTPQLGSMITQKVLDIKLDLRKVNQSLNDAEPHIARKRQQFVMTYANDLALLLNEALTSMQQQMKSGKSGGKPQDKPGKGKPSLSDIKGQQQSLKSQLEQMLKQMKQGKGKKRGMGRKLSEMLAQQEMQRKMLQDLKNGSSLKPGTQKKLNEIQRMMEETENDIAFKRISRSTIDRQEKILSRLLEAENAEKQREFDDKRESREARANQFSRVKSRFETEKLKKSSSESLYRDNVSLNNFYNMKFKLYLQKLVKD